jgi:hypothetical protein
MTITSIFGETSSKRKSEKCQVPENDLHEKGQNMEELTEVQESVGKEGTETADRELKVKKKAKLNGDPEAEMLVSIIIFCSFSKYGKYLVCSRLNEFCLSKLNWQVGVLYRFLYRSVCSETLFHKTIPSTMHS